MTPDERLQQIEKWLHAGGGSSEFCEQEVTWLIAELRDARAENAELSRAHDLMTRQFAVMQVEKEHGWREAERHEDRADAAEVAAERAKVQRVEALCDEYRANCAPDSTQAQVAEIFRSALTGEASGRPKPLLEHPRDAKGSTHELGASGD